MNETIPYLPLPTVCANCTNQLITDTTANPRQGCVSVYCPHEHALITGQCGEVRGERIIGRWSVSGPMSEEEAMDMLNEMAKVQARFQCERMRAEEPCMIDLLLSSSNNRMAPVQTDENRVTLADGAVRLQRGGDSRRTQNEYPTSTLPASTFDFFRSNV